MNKGSLCLLQNVFYAASCLISTKSPTSNLYLRTHDRASLVIWGLEAPQAYLAARARMVLQAFLGLRATWDLEVLQVSV